MNNNNNERWFIEDVLLVEVTVDDFTGPCDRSVHIKMCPILKFV